VQDLFGLAALLLDQECYEEALVELRHILISITQDDNVRTYDKVILEKASSMLFRSNAAYCQWDSYVQNSQQLVDSLRLLERIFPNNNPNDVPVPAVHPFEALKWPCISLPQATQIAALYARRSIASTIQDGRRMPNLLGLPFNSRGCHFSVRSHLLSRLPGWNSQEECPFTSRHIPAVSRWYLSQLQ
jgi:hypothetical protein